MRDLTAAELSAFVMSATPGIRLTLTQGTAITTSDVTSSTTLYVEPLNGGVVPLFRDAAGKIPRIMLLQPSTLSLALGTMTLATPYDIFLYDAGAGSIGMEKLVWTNTTTRATAVDLVNGRYYKHGDYTRLLAGSIYPVVSNSAVADRVVNRLVSNAYNRVRRPLFLKETNASWTYTGSAWRIVNNSSNNAINIISCDGAAILSVSACALGGPTTANFDVATAIGLNGSGTPHANCLIQQAVRPSGTSVIACVASLTMTPRLGASTVDWLEIQDDTTSTFYSEDATPNRRTGIAGWIEA